MMNTMTVSEKGGKTDIEVLRDLYKVYKVLRDECEKLNAIGPPSGTSSDDKAKSLKKGATKTKVTKISNAGRKLAPVKAVPSLIKGTRKVKVAKTSKAEPSSESAKESLDSIKKRSVAPATKPHASAGKAHRAQSYAEGISQKPARGKGQKRPRNESGDVDDNDNGNDEDDTNGNADALSESMMFRVATKKIGQRASKTRKATTLTATGGRRVLGDQIMESESGNKKSRDAQALRQHRANSVGIHKGATHAFYGQKVGAKGMKNATRRHAARPTVVPDAKQQDDFAKYVRIADPYIPHRQNLQDLQAEELFPRWMWQSELNFSVLLHGVGSKRALLERYANDCLENTDCITLDGDAYGAGDMLTSLTGAKIIRGLLDTIWSNVCGHPKIKSFDNLGILRYVDTVVDALFTRYRTAMPILGSFAGKSVDTSIVNADIGGNAVRGSKTVIEPQTGGDVCLPSSSSSLRDLAPTVAPGPRTAAAKKLGLEDYNNDGANMPRGAAERASGLDAKLVGGRELRKGSGLASSKTLPGGGERFYGRYTHNYHRLYILVHSLDAACFRSRDFQNCLSLLAACPCVVLMGSINHLNTPLLWDTEMLARFRWSYQHSPTFECNTILDSDLFSAIKGKNGGSRALAYIMRSLTSKHRDIMSHLAKLELARKARVATAAASKGVPGSSADAVGTERAPPSSEKGVTLAALLDVCTSKLIVRNEQDLRYHLKEPIDHKILNITVPDSDTGAIYISVYLPNEVLETLTHT